VKSSSTESPCTKDAAGDRSRKTRFREAVTAGDDLGGGLDAGNGLNVGDEFDGEGGVNVTVEVAVISELEKRFLFHFRFRKHNLAASPVVPLFTPSVAPGVRLAASNGKPPDSGGHLYHLRILVLE
jgi:hypothetical protein